MINDSVLLGLIALIASVITLLGIVVRFFVSEIKLSRLDHKELTDKFVKVAEENTEARVHLGNAIDANTKATELGINIAKKSNDNLTKLMLKVLKK